MDKSMDNISNTFQWFLCDVEVLIAAIWSRDYSVRHKTKAQNNSSIKKFLLTILDIIDRITTSGNDFCHLLGLVERPGSYQRRGSSPPLSYRKWQHVGAEHFHWRVRRFRSIRIPLTVLCTHNGFPHIFELWWSMIGLWFIMITDSENLRKSW